eukprot:SAG22_NODE_5839_length_945_cov_1.304965_2_plen_46_part_01
MGSNSDPSLMGWHGGIACVVWFKWLAMRKVYLSSSLEHNEKEPRRA